MADLIVGLYENWLWLDERIETITREIEELGRREANCQRLMSIPGVDPLIFTAMVAAIGMDCRWSSIKSLRNFTSSPWSAATLLGRLYLQHSQKATSTPLKFRAADPTWAFELAGSALLWTESGSGGPRTAH